MWSLLELDCQDDELLYKKSIYCVYNLPHLLTDQIRLSSQTLFTSQAFTVGYVYIQEH